MEPRQKANFTFTIFRQEIKKRRTLRRVDVLVERYSKNLNFFENRSRAQYRAKIRSSFRRFARIIAKFSVVVSIFAPFDVDARPKKETGNAATKARPAPRDRLAERRVVRKIEFEKNASVRTFASAQTRRRPAPTVASYFSHFSYFIFFTVFLFLYFLVFSFCVCFLYFAIFVF